LLDTANCAEQSKCALSLQGDLQGLQSAVASWADLEDTRGAEAACRHLLQQADERASLRRSSTTPTASDEEVSLKPVTEIVHPGLSVLHVAAALGSPALVEYIWQVRLLRPTLQWNSNGKMWVFSEAALAHVVNRHFTLLG
jgi:hypothetical protein